MTIVYGVPLSPFVRKVRIAMAEKGLDYELVPVMPMPPHNQTPEYKAISPLGKIPALRDGDFAISDSSVILSYLDRKYPSPALLPKSAEDCARALWFEELADSKVIEAIGPVFFNRIVKPNIMNTEPDQSLIDAGLAALPPLFDYIEGQLGDDGHLVGSTFTVGDVALGSVLRQFEIAGEKTDRERWPKLAGYYDRLAERPSFQTVRESENSFLETMAT